MSDLNRLRELATTLRDDLNLKGPWRWHGYVDGSRPDAWLATEGHGRMYVVGSRRAGMQGSVPVFPVRAEGAKHSTLKYGNEIPVFEVCGDALTKEDPRVYRTDIRGFRSPVADYLAAVDVDTVLGLLDRIAELEAQVSS